MPPPGALARRGRRFPHPRPRRPLAARVSDGFGGLAWVVVVVGGGALGLTGPDLAGTVVDAVMAGAAVALLGRLATAAVAWPARRTATLVLLAALALWGVGSVIQTGAPESERMGFPAPGEIYFFGSYVLMALFLLLDTVHRGRVNLVTAVETTVTVGGAVCLAGAVLLTPVSDRFEGDGVGPLLTLLYPLLDALLAFVVLNELVFGRRAWSRPSRSLLAGFAMLTVADSWYGWGMAQGAYSFTAPLLICWILGLQGLVAGACGPRPEGPSRTGPRAVSPLFVAALVAVVVLTLTPPDLRTLHLIVPAVITLLAAGARLILALREARGATEAYRLSLTDDLTDLPNRRALMARLQAGDGTPVTLLLLDLDGFKEVNDTLGHVAGDQVLRQVARRLRDQLAEDVLVARLGGDEFAIVLAAGDDAAALLAAESVRDIVAAPLAVHGHTFLMGASVGVAISRQRGTRGDLLRRADVAMYQAKTTRAGTLMYDPDRDEFTTDRLKTAELLRLAIPAGQLRAWYQPQVRAGTRQLAGVEALVRWEHPELGVLLPAAFLTVARQTGLMPLLTETVVQLVLNDVRRWHRAGARFQVSFNVAPPELLSAALLERLLARIDAAGLPPGTLVLEVTEDSLLTDPQRARLALLEIRRHQVEVSIDDYGTGFSSLSYLRDLPVNELKLDRSFISTVRSDPRSRIIVASTHQMAQGLGLRTVAEGVEDALTAETVRELGVDLLQGYAIARPMPGEQVLDWQAHWQSDLAGRT